MGKGAARRKSRYWVEYHFRQNASLAVSQANGRGLCWEVWWLQQMVVTKAWKKLPWWNQAELLEGVMSLLEGHPLTAEWRGMGPKEQERLLANRSGGGGEVHSEEPELNDGNKRDRNKGCGTEHGFSSVWYHFLKKKTGSEWQHTTTTYWISLIASPVTVSWCFLKF